MNLSGNQIWTVFDGPSTQHLRRLQQRRHTPDRYLYDAVDEVLARTSSGGTSAWYLTDRLGSVRDVVSNTGTVIDHVIYDSYGQVTSETSPANGDRFKYTGMQYDVATGFTVYYDNARYYDPLIGRFIRQDPLGEAAGDPNFYRYVGNDPTNLTDPSGLRPALANPDVVDYDGGVQGQSPNPSSPKDQPSNGKSASPFLSQEDAHHRIPRELVELELGQPLRLLGRVA